MSENSPPNRDGVRARITRNAARLAFSARRLSESAAHERMQPAQIAALHYAAETLRDTFGEAGPEEESK